jgi:hypothetical protein
MLELLCLSDLHLGESYSFLDRTRVAGGDFDAFARSLLPFYHGVAELAGLGPKDEPRVRVRTLVLLGDVFELATARLATAAAAGRNFFSWLFQWLDADEIVYVPGNHDHVMWMWWKTCTTSATAWWRNDPVASKDPLSQAYKRLTSRTSPPGMPESVAGDALRQDLVRTFFGKLAGQRMASFRLGYPAYCGPSASPPGYPERAFSTVFTHGHFTDPTFVRPASADSGITGLVMNIASWGWGKDAKRDSLDALEASTWEYTHRWWYPPADETTLGERLYLFTTRFDGNNTCLHLCRTPPADYPKEPAPDIKLDAKGCSSSTNDFYTFLQAALGTSWNHQPRLLVYGHTHHGGAIPLLPSVLVCNTGGWLAKVNDRPVHTHLFAIGDAGVAQVKRVDFGV